MASGTVDLYKAAPDIGRNHPRHHRRSWTDAHPNVQTVQSLDARSNCLQP
jgi:hypothetical protein